MIELINKPVPAAAEKAWTEAEAFLRVLLMCAVCNSEHASARLAAVEELKRRSPFLRPIGEKGRIALHMKSVEQIGRCADPIVEACAVIPAAVAPSLFAHALDLLIDDRALNVAEEQLIETLRQCLRIDVARALRMRDVLETKNRW